MTHPIPLDPVYLRCHTEQQIHAAIQRMTASAGWRLTEDGSHLLLAGQDTSYNKVDPWISKIVPHFGADLTREDTLSYRSSETYLDLFFEDSWSGYFLASLMEDRQGEDLVLLHLDDHLDMMSTLLSVTPEGLRDPARDAAFDPRNCADWLASMASGAVCIGNYVTVLFHGWRVHVRHLRERGPHTALQQVACTTRRYEIAPTIAFADLALGEHGEGSYLAQPDPGQLLDDLPEGCLVIHIDLDYFIDDFNGASHGETYVPDPSLRDIAQERIDRLFLALTGLDRPVARWLIATSPGFCCAYHWEWLINTLRSRIEAFEAGREAVL